MTNVNLLTEGIFLPNYPELSTYICLDSFKTYSMKRLLLPAIFALFSTTIAWSQATEVIVETVATDIGVISDFTGDVDLTGYSTYRLYVKYSSQEDNLSAVFGDPNSPTIVHGGNNFYQHEVGGLTASLMQPDLFAVYPALASDSYVTIGLDGPANASLGEVETATIADSASVWSAVFDPGSGVSGGDIIINTVTGGAWYALYDGVNENNGTAGADSLVLIGQFTTNDLLWGQVSLSSFIGGVQAMDTLQTFAFSSNPGAIFGCTDMDASNYDAASTDDDGSCVFACDFAGTMLSITMSSATGVSCFGGSNGVVNVTSAGGQGSVFYSDGVSNNVTGTFNNQLAGEVTVTVTDNQGCFVSETLTVSTPDVLDLNASLSSPVSCNGFMDAVISGSAMGGTGMLSYSLDEFFMETSAELNFEDIAPGLFTVYVMDENGCSVNSPAILVEDPAEIVSYVSAVLGTVCPGSDDGTIVLNYYGGSGSETTFSIDGTSYQDAGNFMVSAGVYYGYAMDVNGCVDMTDSIVVATPSDFMADAALTSPTCNGYIDGAMSVEIQGGSGDLMYAYMGDTTSTFSLSAIAAGVFAIGVIDESGCSGTVDVELTEPAAINLTALVMDVLCNGDENGSIDLSAEGGDGTFSFAVDTGSFGAIVSFGDLVAGDYTYTAQDGAGCESTTVFTVGSPDALEMTIDANDGASGEESDAVVDVTVTGGTMPYVYAWSGPDTFSADTEDLSEIMSGEYVLLVTDTNGCVLTGETVVVLSGVGELTHNVSISLYPNPSTGLFSIQVNGLAGDQVVSQLVDAQGRIISEESWGMLNGEASRTMNLTSAASGLYFVHMQVGAEASTLRVVKH